MGYPVVRYRWSGLNSLSKAVFLLSLLGLATSLVLVAGTVWLKVKVGDHLDLAIPKEGYLWPGALATTVALVGPGHLLGVGLRASLARNFTSAKLIRKSRKCMNRLLVVHALLSFASGILVFGVCAGGAYLWGMSRRRVKQGLHLAVRRYPVDTATKLRLDRLQLDLGCCGSETYADWFFVPWMDRVPDQMNLELEVEEDDVDPALLRRIKRSSDQYFSADVPYSCCTTDSQDNCTHHDMIAEDKYRPEALSSISSEGCTPKLLERANDAGIGVIACLLLISVYQVVVSVMVRLMQTARLCALRANAKGEFFVGWIFGSSPKNQCHALEIQSLKEYSDDSSSGRSMPQRQTGGADGGKKKKTKACRARMREYNRKKRKARQRADDDDEENVRILNSSGVFNGRCRRVYLDQNDKSKDWRAKRQQHRANDSSKPAAAAFVRRVDKRRRRTAESSSSSSSSLAQPAATPKRAPRSCPLHGSRRISSTGSSSCCPVHGPLR